MPKAKTDIIKMHKKCVALFLKNQELIYGVQIRNGSGTLSLEVSFVRDKFPSPLPWITFYAFQGNEFSFAKLAALEKYLLTGIAEFEKMQ